MNDNVRTLVFAAALALVCSLLLAATSRFTEPYRTANEKAEEVRNFLSALQVPFESGASPEELVDAFERNVRVSSRDAMTIYEYVQGNGAVARVAAVAVPFAGPGLWGPIQAVAALEPDLQTLRAVRFYKQEETPGLGGEIGSDWFQAQFAGKKLVSETGSPAFHVGHGHGKDANGVDAVTGATMTSDRVQDMLNALADRLHNERENR